MKWLNIALMTIILHLAVGSGLAADAPRNTITLDNKSGESALVKLIGPTAQVIEVPNGARRTVNVAAGEYYLLARYGVDPRQYSYSRGRPFQVEETTTKYSLITITLHKVLGGNYATRPASRDEFEKPVAASPTMAKGNARPTVPAQSASPGRNIVAVSGTLVSSDNRPLQGAVIFLMVSKGDGPRDYDFPSKDGKFDATTDTNGFFTLSVDGSDLGDSKELTLVVRPPNSMNLGRLTIGGKALVIPIDPNAFKTDVDFGRLTIH